MSHHQLHQRPPETQDDADLRARREALGLSRADVAVKARCAINTLTLIEQGVTRKGITREKIISVLTELEQAA